MDKSNIVKLAKIFDKFIELETSFVLVEDIRAIRKVEGTVESTKDIKGIEVITPHGAFFDATDFDTFKTRIGDVSEALKEKESVKRPASPVERKIVSVNESMSEPGYRRVNTNSKSSAGHVMDKEVTITLSGNGSSGTLYDEPDYKVVNRNSIQILSPDGSLVATGTKGGTIMGEFISGIIYENGRYTLAAKNYTADNVTVQFQVQEK